MAIGYVSKASVVNATATGSSVVPVPAGVAAGHRMLCVVCSIANAVAVTPPAGWTPLGEYAPGTGIKSAAYVRDVVGAEPASYTWGWSANGRNLGYCVAYSGTDLAVTPSATPTVHSNTEGPGLSPALSLSAGDWLVTVAVGKENPGTDLVKEWSTDDGADAERFDFYTANLGTAAKLAGAWWDSARALGAGAHQRALTVSQPLAQWHAWSIHLPVTSTPPPPATPGAWSHMGMPIVR